MKNRYKIIHIAFKHSSNDTRIFRKQCVSLAKKSNYDITYITSDINSPSELSSSMHLGVHKKIMKAYPKRVIRQFKYIKQIKNYIKENPEIDLIQIHEPILLLLAVWVKRQGIKVVFDSHEDYYKQMKLRFRNNIIMRTFIPGMYKAYEKYVCKKIDAVIFPCKLVDKQVFDYEVKRLIYLDNYPLLEKVREENKKDFLACYVGAISYERGVVNDIKAWKSANIIGILAGNFGNEKLETQIRQMKEFKNVDYRGYCNAEDIRAIYREASVGMATLLDYGQYHKLCNLPTKVWEYMMYGIPTIISRTPFVEHIMKVYEFGIMVDPENIDEITDAIRYLKENPEISKNMGKNGKRAVEENYNWSVEEKKLFDLYNDILN